jgi:lysophospholipase L1-like esterase
MNSLKRNLVRSFIVFVSLILTFGILETLMRTVFVSQVSPRSGWAETYVSLNSLGFRDREHNLEKNDNTFRIIIFGDSLAYGTWINQSKDILPNLLEKYLNQGLNKPKFEVFNFSGQGGWRTGDQMHSYFNTGIRYKPDLVLIALSPNDIPFPEKYDLYKKKSAIDSYLSHMERRLTKKSHLFQFLINAKNAMWIELGFIQPYLEQLAERFNNRGWEMQKIYFDYFYHFSRIHRTHFAVGILPFAIQLDDSYPLLPGISKIMDFCETRNIICVDIFQNGFKNHDPASFATYPLDNHFNEKGHEISAKVIYRKLEPLKKLNNLTKFHKAFNFPELINGEWFIKELNKQFDQIKPGLSPTVFKSDSSPNRELKVWKDSVNLYIQKVYDDKLSPNKKVIEIVVLNHKGEFIQSNKKMIDKQFQNITTLQNHFKEKGEYILKEDKRETNSVFPEVFFQSKGEENIFFFGTSAENIFQYTFGPSIEFVDPLVIERRVFRDKNIFFGKRKSEDIWFKILNSFYSWPKYFDSFVAEIMVKKPMLSFLLALKRTYIIRQNQEKLNLLYEEFPHLKNITPLKN